MRHGQAEMLAASDAQRPLTQSGIEEAQVMGQWLLKNSPAFDCIFVSPYTRAQQTADAVINELTCVAKRETLAIITPEDNAKDVHGYLDAICSQEQYKSILLVSHMPLVSYLVAELTVDHVMPMFQTASVANIAYNLDEMSGELLALVSPNDIEATL